MRTALVAFLILLAGTAGCTVTTNDPLADPVTTPADSSLYGHWIAEFSKHEGDPKSESHLFIGKHEVSGNPKSILEFVAIDWRPEELRFCGELKREYFTSATIGKNSYVCLLEPSNNLTFVNGYRSWSEDPSRRCAIFRYECDGKTLRLFGPPRDFENRIKKLAVDGVLTMVGKIVTADSLARFLRAEGSESLFDQEGFMARKAR
jgi:hypothetical protein